MYTDHHKRAVGYSKQMTIHHPNGDSPKIGQLISFGSDTYTIIEATAQPRTATTILLDRPLDSTVGAWSEATPGPMEERPPLNGLDPIVFVSRPLTDERAAEKSAETADEQQALYALPRLACGSLGYPGRMIGRYYLGSHWVARIVYVGETTIDIQYTNQGSHAAKGSVSRLVNPKDWMDLAKFRDSTHPARLGG